MINRFGGGLRWGGCDIGSPGSRLRGDRIFGARRMTNFVQSLSNPASGDTIYSLRSEAEPQMITSTDVYYEPWDPACRDGLFDTYQRLSHNASVFGGPPGTRVIFLYARAAL